MITSVAAPPAAPPTAGKTTAGNTATRKPKGGKAGRSHRLGHSPRPGRTDQPSSRLASPPAPTSTAQPTSFAQPASAQPTSTPQPTGRAQSAAPPLPKRTAQPAGRRHDRLGWPSRTPRPRRGRPHSRPRQQRRPRRRRRSSERPHPRLTAPRRPRAARCSARTSRSVGALRSPARSGPRARRYRIAGAAAVVTILAAGAITHALLGKLAGRGGGRPPGRPGGRGARPGRGLDRRPAEPVRRRLLRPGHVRRAARSWPPGRRRGGLTSGQGNPLRSAVMVATSVVRRDFGSRLATVDAPGVIARFGSAASSIQVRVIAAHGAAAYRAALQADLTQRRGSGADLLYSGRLSISGAARAQRPPGMSTRGCWSPWPRWRQQHPIEVMSLGDRGPGAHPKRQPVPLRRDHRRRGGGRPGFRTVSPELPALAAPALRGNASVAGAGGRRPDGGARRVRRAPARSISYSATSDPLVRRL